MSVKSKTHYSSILPWLSTLFYFLIFAIVVPGFHFFLGASLDRLIGNPCPDNSALGLLLGGIFLACGLYIILTSTYALWRTGKGLPVSSIPPRHMVENGIYRFSRHPIYLGATICFAGMGLCLHSFWNLILSMPLLFLFYFAYALCVEEPVLISRFSNRYDRYRDRVPIVPFVPFRSQIKRILSIALESLSRKINRPFILSHGNHIFFLGYGLWCGIGVMLGLAIFNWLLVWNSIPSSAITLLLIVITIACLLGIRFLWIASYLILEKKNIALLRRRVGFMSWGVLLGTLFTSLIFIKMTGRSLYLFLDCALFAQMITHFFGRIGCLHYGCCYGIETSSDISINYRNAVFKAVREKIVNPEKLYPVQLFSASYGLIIFLLVMILWHQIRMPIGLPAVLICILYALLRFSEEWCRMQKKRYWNLLTPAQIWCAVLLLIGAVHLIFYLSNATALYYPPFAEIFTAKTFSGLNSLLLLFLGLLATLTFSYHRYQVGQWAR